MMATKEHAPFPHLPGEGSRLTSREWVLKGNETPPGYLTIALRALDNGVLPSAAPPKMWLAEFDSVVESREALRDIGNDFGIFSSSYADGTVAEWKDQKTSEELTTARALKKLWSGYAGRLVRELDGRQISPHDELERIATEWAAFRKDRRALEEREAAARAAHEEVVNRDFANQAFWPGSSVLYWIYVRKPQRFEEDSTIIAELSATLPSLTLVAELFVTNAREALWQECKAGRVKVYGRQNGSGALAEVPLLELQAEGVRLSEDMDARPLVRTASDLYWSSILFSAADVMRSFPPMSADGTIPRSGNEAVDRNLDVVDRAANWGERDETAVPDATYAAMIKAGRAYADAQTGKIYLVDVYKAIAAHGLRMPGAKLKPRIASRMRELYPDRINASGARRRSGASAEQR